MNPPDDDGAALWGDGGALWGDTPPTVDQVAAACDFLGMQAAKSSQKYCEELLAGSVDAEHVKDVAALAVGESMVSLLAGQHAEKMRSKADAEVPSDLRPRVLC